MSPVEPVDGEPESLVEPELLVDPELFVEPELLVPEPPMSEGPVPEGTEPEPVCPLEPVVEPEDDESEAGAFG